MFVHSVYFWLRQDLSADERQTFIRGVESLTQIESVRHGWVGVPAPTDRPVIERSYSYALTAVFADAEGQEQYQVDPVHDRFRDDCGTFWTKVLIYDSVDDDGRGQAAAH